MYIEAKAGRTSNIDVRLYDPRYSETALAYTEPGPDSCVTTYTYTYPTQTTSGWTGPTSSTSNLTINGPRQYQTRTNSTTTTWSAVGTLTETQSYTFRADRLRYRSPTTTTPSTTCTPTTVNKTEAAIDDYRLTGTDDYTFTLYGADNTPLNDDDNPKICEKTYTPTSAFDGYEFLGSRRWNTLCTISSTALSGKYILRVHNKGSASSPLNDGSNQWGLVARYTNSAGDGLCDGRTDAMCPRVYGKEAISVRAAATTSVASFYLAEIGPEHAGKKLKIDLWDPGEGGQNLSIQVPTGANTWAAVPVTWTSAGVGSGSGTTIDVTGNKFNGKLLQITVDLTGYNPPANNRWWQIKYNFSGTVTDRTTWSARITGDPVHLLEEN